MVAGAQEGSPLSGDSAHNGQSIEENRATGNRATCYVRVRDRARVVSERLGGWVGRYNREL